jgi:general secretion pathway protein G
MRTHDTFAAAVRRRARERGEGGFTLIELLVVLSIILILSSLALTQYRNSVQLAREAALRSDLYLMRDAIDQYYADKGKYPESLDTLVSDHYLRVIPPDPITRAADTWQTVQAEPVSSVTSAAAGIYYVKSGATDAAFDVSRYADW